MIYSACCNAEMRINARNIIKTTGEHHWRFRCTCCGATRSAYSKDGEVWKWEQRNGRPVRDLDMVFA